MHIAAVNTWLIHAQVQLVDYSLNAVNEGIEALATTRVTIRPDGRLGNEAYVTSYQVCKPCLPPLHNHCMAHGKVPDLGSRCWEGHRPVGQLPLWLLQVFGACPFSVLLYLSSMLHWNLGACWAPAVL